jgi:DNA ligase (NAD+)
MAKRTALDIEGLGGIVADALVEQHILNEPLDLFSIERSGRLEEVLSCLNLGTADEPRIFGEKNALKLAESVRRARSLPLARWLHALAIPEVGETVAHQLAQVHESLEEVASSPVLRDVLALARRRQSEKGKKGARSGIPADEPQEEQPDTPAGSGESAAEIEERLLAKGFAKKNVLKSGSISVVTTVGPVVAQAVFTFFSSPRGAAILKQLAELGIAPRGESGPANPGESETKPLTGKSFAITGTLPALSRSEATEMIRKAGGMVTDSITRKTHYLVAGEGGGSKRQSAEALGVPILSEQSLLELLQMSQSPSSPSSAPSSGATPHTQPTPLQGLLF